MDVWSAYCKDISPDEDDQVSDIHSRNGAKKNPFSHDAISAQTLIREPSYEFISDGVRVLKNRGFRIFSLNNSCRDRI